MLPPGFPIDRFFHGAFRGRDRATRMKTTAFGWVKRAGYIAFEESALPY